MSPQTEKGLGQASVMHARRGEAKAGQKACGGNGHQDVETHVRADAAAPAFVSNAGQPASSSPFDATNRDTGGIQDLIELFGLAQSERGEQASDLFDQLRTSMLTSHKLAVVGKHRKGGFQMTLRKAIKGLFAGKSRPFSRTTPG